MKNQEIGDAFNTLLCDIADCDDKYCKDEVISWFVAAVLRIWAGNKLFSQTYVEALSSFTNKTYTTTQVMTALDLVSDESLKIKVPEFFQNIVSKDIKSHTCKSRTLADSIGRFLVQMALINGDFTIDEANALKDISDILLDYCDSQGVSSGKTREYHPEMVTPLKAESYTNPTIKENNKPIKREEMQNNDNSDLNNDYDEFDEDDYDEARHGKALKGLLERYFG